MYFDTAAIEDAPQPNEGLARQIAQFVARHGTDADIVAAQHADSFFRAGDVVNGERWSVIFRQIAASHSAAIRAY